MATKGSFKLTVSYFLLFILLVVLLVFGYMSSRTIENTISNLVGTKVPSLIYSSNLKQKFQTQTIQLYELYATNDEAKFEDDYAKNKAAILVETENLRQEPKYEEFAALIEALSDKQDLLANDFVTTMAQSNVDWDAARENLARFSESSVKIERQLDEMILKISNEAEVQAKNSKQALTKQFNYGIILAGLVLACLLFNIFSTRGALKHSA